MRHEKNEIALRYAIAIFKHAIELKSEKELFADIVLLKEIIAKDQAFTKIFSSPLITKEQKHSFIKKLKLNMFTENFISFLFNEQRGDIFEVIIEKLKNLLLEYNNKVDVELITACNVEDKDIQRINNIVKKFVNKDAYIYHKIDQSILGGLIIKIQNKILDASLLKKLKIMKDFSNKITLELE